MNKVLVIGSKGFIGSHLIHFLSGKKSEYECYGCDVVSDYVSNNYFLADATQSDFSEIFISNHFDYCINCSGAASVPDSLSNPLRDFTLNVLNVARLLEAIRKYCPDCKFINLSSAAVYGNPVELPVSEKAITAPMSPYGKHKLMAEELCKEYADIFSIKTLSARIFSAYGPGLQKQLLWDISQKASASDLELFGTGDESRDFIYIADIVCAIELLMLKGDFCAGIYNVANGEEITVKSIANLLLEKLDYTGNVRFNGKGRAGDPIRWRADIGKIQQLGYTTTFTLEHGINFLVEWLKGIK